MDDTAIEQCQECERFFCDDCDEHDMACYGPVESVGVVLCSECGENYESE